MFDFFERMKGKDVNKRVVEHLIQAGGLDCLDSNRSKLLGCFEEVIEKMTIAARYAQDGQVGLFQSLDQDIYTDIIEGSSYVEMSHLEQLRLEKELTIIYQFIRWTNLLSNGVHVLVWSIWDNRFK